MMQVRKLVTIIVIAFTFLSCSSDENIGFDFETEFSKTIGKVEADRATIVMALDDSGSMISKVNELSSHLKGMFTDLVSAGWEIDLHVVTCSYHNEKNPMRSASTLSVKDKNAVKSKVEALMAGATPTIDLSTLEHDGDERCNQSLERAWSKIVSNNKVNISMLVSNEDGCARTEKNFTLTDVNGGKRNNCAPVTFGRISGHSGKDLINSNDGEWEAVVAKYSKNVWIPWFNRTISKKTISPDYYIDFFKNLEAEGKKRVSSFSHIYLPIVVDTNKCLAESLRNQALAEKAKFIKTNGADAKGFRPMNTVGNIGYAYLDTFEGLKQENILFNKDKGDLSLCDDLSHVVSKIQREIKLRGQSVKLMLTREIDVKTMNTVYPDSPIIRVEREIKQVSSENFFVEQNKVLSKLGLSWTKISPSKYALNLYLTSPMVGYNSQEPSILITNSELLTVTGGDRVVRLQYLPSSFRDGQNKLIYNGE